MLILITIDHFLPDENIIKHFTYEFVGWVTAAEGFVFLSGLTAGIIYSRKMLEKGESFVAEAVKKRAWLIYRNHILILGFALLIVLCGHSVNSYWLAHYNLFVEKPGLSILLGSILLYQPIYLDILPMYAVYILFVPIIIKCFNKGLTARLFLLSFLLYLLSFVNQLYGFTSAVLRMEDINTGCFNLLSWQFIFMIGLLLGHYHCQGKSKQLQSSKTLLLLSIFICLSIFLAKNLHLNLESYDYLTSKGNLGPVRLLNCMALIFIVTYIASKKSGYFSSKAFCYLGRHSLDVYSLHIVLIIVFKPLIEHLNKINYIKLNRFFYFYPVSTIVILFLIVPALYLAPTLFSKKTYTLWKGRGHSISEEATATSSPTMEGYRQAV
jgi:hypothetical protein